MKDTLIKLIAPLVAIIAIVGKEFNFEIGPDETNTIVAAIAIVITALQNAINLRKPPPAALLALVLLPAMLVSVGTTQTGCAVFEKMDKSEVGKTVIQSAIRLTTYLVVANNPALAPVANGVGLFMANITQSFNPEAMKELIIGEFRDLTTREDLSPSEIALVRSILDDALRVYGQAWDIYKDDPEAVVDTELTKLLSTLGTAIQEGVTLTTAEYPASSPPITTSYRKMVVEIQ